MNKIRYDLLPTLGLEEVHKLFTSKLNKYQKNQWTLGLSWSDVLNSLEYHLSEFKKGNDYNKEGLLNIGEVAMNALILCQYVYTYPQGDDRVIKQVNDPIIGCDLDDVIFDFVGAYESRFGKMSSYWNGDYNMSENLKELQKDKDFWVNMPVKTIVPFEIDYYITARSIPIEWTQEAIQKNNLPKAPIYSLPWNESKIETLKKLNVDVLIDDKYKTYKECKQNGIFCYLVTTEANKRYDVGHHRIKSLADLKNLK